MKILIINTSDTGGGASKAASRLFDALLHTGVNVKMMVHEKKTTHPNVVAPVAKGLQILQSRLDKYEFKVRGIKPRSFFSIARFGNDITKHRAFMDADVINIHWVNRGFLSIENLGAIFRSGKKIIWTLHDSWAFTGGCHLPYDCIRYQSHCGSCPGISSLQQHDLTYQIMERKCQSWKDASLTLFTPSKWLALKSGGSKLFKDTPTTVFPNALNTDVFRTYDKKEVRQELELPQAKKIILFGAMNATSDANKGYTLLLESLELLLKRDITVAQKYALCVFGSNATIALPMEVCVMGTIESETTMAKLYAAADVFVLPSKSENLPYTIMESLACGTPAVAFDVGGISELIQHAQNGYLAQCYDTSDLAEGIHQTLAGVKVEREVISNQVKSVYGYESVAQQFLKNINVEYSATR